MPKIHPHYVFKSNNFAQVYFVISFRKYVEHTMGLLNSKSPKLQKFFLPQMFGNVHPLDFQLIHLNKK